MAIAQLEGTTLLPTPREALSRARVEARQDWHGNLEEVLERLLPTPTARDWKDSGDNTNYERQAKKSLLAGVVMTELFDVGNES